MTYGIDKVKGTWRVRREMGRHARKNYCLVARYKGPWGQALAHWVEEDDSEESL